MLKINSKPIIYAMSGNIAEWYDFYIYSMFAAPIISELFLPKYDKYWSLIFVYFTFAMGFLMRPFGALIFGYFGDKYGRKSMLVFSLYTMGAVNLLLIALPTYSSIGIMAPTLLIVIRLLQGFAVGGEIGGATAFVLENSPTGRKNLAGGLLICSSFIALFLSSSTAFMMSIIFDEKEIISWAWRIPFIFGCIIIFMGIYTRKKIIETREFSQLQGTVGIPLIIALKLEWRNMLRTFMLSSMIAVLVFMGFAYMPVYIKTYIHYNLTKSLFSSSLGVIFLITSSLISAMLADRYNGRKIMIYGGILLFIFSIPIYQSLINYPAYLNWVIIFFSTISGMNLGPIFANTSGLFQTKVRYTGFGVSFNLGVAIFGGTSPMLITYLISKSGILLIPAFYLMALSVLFIITLVTIKY